MKKIVVLLMVIAGFSACSESERPAAQAKHALDAAQHAADLSVQHSQEVLNQAAKSAGE
jgi:uncharacterized lipoprotein